MSIHWYPGHMHKARRQMQEILRQVDLIVEVLDARIPFSSSNPDIAALAANKAHIKLLNKADLSDKAHNQTWLKALESEQDCTCLVIDKHNKDSLERIKAACRSALPQRKDAIKTWHIMISGIPNVGKSSLINLLAGKKIARTGNEPAITKSQQRINLGDGLLLIDTPGILWPRVDNPASAYRLALTGAIRETALEYADLALFLIEHLQAHNPEAINTRYRCDPYAEALEILENAASHRGCLNAGKRVDFDRIARLMIHEFRQGLLGSQALESPEQIEAERREMEIRQAERIEQKKPKRKAKTKR